MPKPPARPTPFGDSLRRLRTRAGYSQAELARAAGCERAYITQLESGERDNVSLKLARALARALAVPLLALIGDEPVDDATAVLEVERAKAGPLRRIADRSVEEIVKIERAARIMLTDGEPPPHGDDQASA